MIKDNMQTLVNTNRSAVMGVAALWIFFFHLWIPLGNHFLFEFFRATGFVGVDFFFLLSGMGLIYAGEKYTTRVFYIRRLERVFLPYGVMAVVFKFLKGWNLNVFLKNLLCIHFYTRETTSFLWFVPAILTLYFLFPLYYRLFRRAGSKDGFTVAMVLLWLALTGLFTGIPETAAYLQRTNMYVFLNRIPIFLTGIYLGWWFRERQPVCSLWGWGMCAVMFVIGMQLIRMTSFQGRSLLVPRPELFLPAYLMSLSGVMLAAKTIQLVSRYGRVPGAWLVKGLTFMGRTSLEFYCVHEEVGERIKALAEGRISDVVLNLVVFAVSVFAAVALDVICKCMRQLGKRMRKRPAVAV